MHGNSSSRRARSWLVLGAAITTTAALAAAPAATAVGAGTTKTTVTRTIVAPSAGDPRQIGLAYGAGEKTIVPKGFSTRHLRSLVSFVQMTDIHLTDEESAGRLEFLRFIDDRFAGAYRPDESLTLQTFQSLLKAVRNTVSPLTGAEPAFTVATGDGADTQQYNEVRWLIDMLRGGQPIVPDTGAAGYDGMQGAPYYDPTGVDNGETFQNLPTFPNLDLFEAAQQPFSSVGVGMPWYVAFGNHDALVQGNVPLAYTGQGGALDSGIPADQRGHVEVSNPKYQSPTTGDRKLEGIPPDADPTSTLISIILNPASALDNPDLQPYIHSVPADPTRCYLAKVDNAIGDYPAAPEPCADTSFVSQVQAASGLPTGHGFTPAAKPTGYGWPATAIANHDGYYSFKPSKGFRFVVLDTVTDECGLAQKLLCDFGSLDSVLFDWLAGQLKAAKAAGQRVVILSHHPLDRLSEIDSPDKTETWKSPADVEALLCANPAVVAALSGHTHKSLVSYAGCGRRPGFARIQTTSAMDWPQQARLVEVVANAKGKLAVVTTMIDQAAPPQIDTTISSATPTQLASISRVIAYELDLENPLAAGRPQDRNVLIPLRRSLG
jgi:3',5'-cyclic AMP phosphodiesterase CpdA